MFLIPALGAFTADVVIAYLNITYRYLFENHGFWTIKNISYLLPLSILRLLLLVPYNYHTLSGTRLRLPSVYSTIHALSGIVVFAHFLAFALYTQGTNDNIDPNAIANTTDTAAHININIDSNDLDLHSNDNDIDNSSSALLMADIDDSSLKTTNNIDNNNDVFFDEIYADSDADVTTTYELIWILLTLSLCSISLHIVILLHVRSTGPSDEVIRRKFEEGQSWRSTDSNHDSMGNNISNGSNGIHRKRKMLAYWVYDRYRRENNVEAFKGQGEDFGCMSPNLFQMKNNAVGQLSPIQSQDRSKLPAFTLDSDVSFSDDEEIGDVLSDDMLSSSTDEFYDAKEEENLETEGLLIHGESQSFDDNMHYFPGRDNLNAFDEPIIPRRRRKKISPKEESIKPFSWRDRSAEGFRGLVDLHSCLSKHGYDDFLSEIRSRFQEAKREWDTRLEEVTRRMSQNENGANAGNFLMQLRQHTPFRALLHLYAHEDVFLNHRLDNAFSAQNQSAISFYAPQLLCFLLHNAYLSTGRLEQWILDKCKTNTQFAHQCFWFLRAWCLQGGIYRPEDDLEDGLTASKSHDMEVNYNKMSPSYHGNGGGSKSPSRSGSISGSMHSFAEIKGLVKHPSVQDLKKTSGIKLTPEERNAVEGLLAKIIECGEMSTRRMESGTSNFDENDTLNEHEAQPLESSPLHCNHNVEANNGFTDVGFLGSPSDNHTLGLMPKTHSSVRLSENGQEINSYFLRTPDFLDSLMAIADDLIEEPYLTRTPELRKRLNQLESDMLPSKSIYVPVNGSMHHLCRIVSSESFAISTKERVPCIVYLEVIDHISNSQQKYINNEDDILNEWYRSPRHPQRHNTIFTKVTESLKKLRHDLEENHDKIFRDSSSHDEMLPINTDETDVELNNSSLLSSKTSAIVFKEDWETKVQRIRLNSAFSNNPNWRLLPILIKTNDDIRQEQLAAQLIHSMASILSRAKVPVWLYPYDIIALSFRGGIMEAIPDTISIDSLRKKHPDFEDLRNFFQQHFGEPGCDTYENAKANFVESLAAYSIVCFLLQIKDRHNGNIMLDNKGHVVHIDFGFYFLSSPGKNSGFESAPFKLTRDFVEVMGGVKSHSFNKFRELCYRTFLELRRNCFQITLLVQMLIEGNEDLDCFRGTPHEAVEGLQERFRLDLNDKACVEYVNSLINDSVENWTTTCYDRYQRCCVGIM